MHTSKLLSISYYTNVLLILITYIFSPTLLLAIELIQNDQIISMITINNQKGGEIQYFNKKNKTMNSIGTVVSPSINPEFEPFSAFRWGRESTVVATAVNILRIKISETRCISIYPSDNIPYIYYNFDTIHSNAFIVTDIKSGTGIFGEFAPPVGSPVRLIRNNKETAWPEFYEPQIGDKIIIYIVKQQYNYR